MKEIKFRAWDKQFDIMLNNVVVYDENNVAMVDVAFNEAYGDRIDERHEEGTEDAGPEWVCITGNLNIMQFIGLVDMNGKNVYEDDIILIHWIKGDETTEKITYDNKYGYWKYGNNPICELYDPETSFEVIGNIYEHPNSLK